MWHCLYHIFTTPMFHHLFTTINVVHKFYSSHTQLHILWRINPFLGKDLETNNVTNVACTAVAMQQADKSSDKHTVSRQRIGKHVPAATNTHTTIVLLLETVFYTRSVQSGYKEENWGDPVSCYLLVDTERVESPDVKRIFYVCYRYSDTVMITVLKSVARI
jgi:hypothetical protein